MKNKLKHKLYFNNKRNRFKSNVDMAIRRKLLNMNIFLLGKTDSEIKKFNDERKRLLLKLRPFIVGDVNENC